MEAAPLHSPRVRLSFRGSETPAFLDAPSDPEGLRLRHELEHARLARGFDELLCLKAARGVDHCRCQIETAERALKRFRGRRGRNARHVQTASALPSAAGEIHAARPSSPKSDGRR